MQSIAHRARVAYSKGMQKQYDLVVIGAGSGGLTAIETALALGARVALVEKSGRLGGECLHAGCVPSKALLAAAQAAESARQAVKYGIHTEVRVDYAGVHQHVHDAIRTIEQESENDEYFEKRGVDIYHGEAKFIDQSVLAVGTQQVRGRRFIIATGSGPAVPDIPGLEDVGYDTNETIFNHDTLPQRLAVIGGGPIGCELGQAYARLGSEVTILQHGDRLLPKEDQRVSSLMADVFNEDGIHSWFNTEIIQVGRSEQGIVVRVRVGDEERQLEVDRLLVAAGRRPNTNLDLEKARVKYGDRGIEVDKKLRTSNHHIYAIGDCVGQFQFTHYAGEQGVLAATNALLRIQRSWDPSFVPWVTFTAPEIARAGKGEDELKEAGMAYRTHETDYSNIDKAVTEGAKGYVQILTDAKDKKILGATVVGPHASEVINPVALAMGKGLSYHDLSSGMRSYPTYGLAVKQQAGFDLLKHIVSKPFFGLLKRF